MITFENLTDDQRCWIKCIARDMAITKKFLVEGEDSEVTIDEDDVEEASHEVIRSLNNLLGYPVEDANCDKFCC